ncbi:lipopolysaccharide transport periplasmic protein LptA [Geomonas sp. Red276]
MMRSFFLMVVVLMLTASHLWAAPAATKEPLTIKSDTLNADNEKKTAVFEGKVVARQGDMTLYADRLVITYSGDGKELSKVEAYGNVRMLQGNRQATGGHAVYHPKERTIVLDQSPKVVQGNDVVTGSEITYYLDQQRSVARGGQGRRVEVVIHPGEQNVGKKP